tara:strand:- start:746 stop:1012 length:267 start_codon:yes stop_codon:yes gene_type:complete
MKKNEAYKILKYNDKKKIVEIKKPPHYFLDKHSHDFEVDIIVLSGDIEITLSNSSITLLPGSRLKLKKNEEHTEKAGDAGVHFLSVRD